MQTRPTRQQIESLILEVLADHGFIAPPINVKALARAKGLPIVEQAMESDVSGALVNLGGTNHGIAVNAAHAPVRKRFTIAHELGHFLLGHDPGDHLDWGFTVLRRDGRSSEANDFQEIEANFFAASILMPKHMLRADVNLKRGFHGEVELNEAEIMIFAKKYGVSGAAMEYRLKNLGFLSFA